MGSEFPNCLRKQENTSASCTQLDTAKAANSIFVFPEKRGISWEMPLKWPVWFRAAEAGTISLCITIYYEIEDESSILTYRMLRMHYNLEVLPSLEVSFQTSPCPSKLQEFLVQMQVVNRTRSEIFQLHQLSCVGDQWELVMLQQTDSVSSFEPIIAGQALSYFFKLKNCSRQSKIEDEKSSFSSSRDPDVRLDKDSQGLFDTSISPLILFHNHERLHQERQEKDHGCTVDFIMIYESQSGTNAGLQRTAGLLSHHTCHCSIATESPIWWIMDGPKSIRHDFSTFCEINMVMTVYNSSEDLVSVRFIALDFTHTINSVASSPSSGNEVGWHDISHPTELRVTTDVTGARAAKTPLTESIAPFIWSGTSSTRFNIEPRSSAQVPLKICVFAPGTYDLSNYLLHWNRVRDDENGSKASSGKCPGHSYHISVLQQD